MNTSSKVFLQWDSGPLLKLHTSCVGYKVQHDQKFLMNVKTVARNAYSRPVTLLSPGVGVFIFLSCVSSNFGDFGASWIRQGEKSSRSFLCHRLPLSNSSCLVPNLKKKNSLYGEMWTLHVPVCDRVAVPLGFIPLRPYHSAQATAGEPCCDYERDPWKIEASRGPGPFRALTGPLSTETNRVLVVVIKGSRALQGQKNCSRTSAPSPIFLLGRK